MHKTQSHISVEYTSAAADCIHFWNYVCISCNLMKMQDSIYSIWTQIHSLWLTFITLYKQGIEYHLMTMHALEGKLAEVNSVKYVAPSTLLKALNKVQR